MSFMFRIAAYTFHQVVVTKNGINFNLVDLSGNTIVISN